MPGKEALLHISEIDWKRFETMEESGLKEGEMIDVKLIGVDEKTGKLKLSHRALLPKPEGYVERERRPRATASVAATTGTATDPSDAFRREIDGVFVRRRSENRFERKFEVVFLRKKLHNLHGILYICMYSAANGLGNGVRGAEANGKRRNHAITIFNNY